MSPQHHSDRLTPGLLLQAYRIGYFPMAEDRDAKEVFWVRPDERGIIPLDRFHIPKSLRKKVRQDRYNIHVNTAFAEVMEGCAMVQSHRPSTWINKEIFNAYTELHRLGHAHSVEAFSNDELVGGLYGVSIGGAFFGESMFSIATDASKICLVHLVGRLTAGGYQLLDTQFLNDHLIQFGTIEMTHAKYQTLLESAVNTGANFFAVPPQVRGSTILQSITQTS